MNVPCYLQVKGVEEQNDIFALVVFKWDFLELSIHNCGTFENWGRFLQIGDWHFQVRNSEGLHKVEKEMFREKG